MRSKFAIALAVLLSTTIGCSPAGTHSESDTPKEIGATVGALMQKWDPDVFRSIDYQPDNPDRQKHYADFCFLPMNKIASEGISLEVTKIEERPEKNEARVYFDLIFKGQLKVKAQETDPNRPDLYDRGHLLLIRTNGAWKLKEISF